MINFSVEVLPTTKKLERLFSFFGQRSLNKLLDEFCEKEAGHIKEKITENIHAGGKPAFPAASAFTVAIRKANGQPTNISYEAILVADNLIVRKQAARRYHITVDQRRRVETRPGHRLSLSEVASLVEYGRPSFSMVLDRPSPQSGKTPRQWFWWLFLSGIIDHPVSPGTKAITIAPAAPKRPFSNTLEQESKTTTKRLLSFTKKQLVDKGVGRIPGIGVFFK